MPHLMIDYSANIEADVDMGALCDTLRDVATSIDAFPLACLLYTSPSPRDLSTSRMPSSA